MPRKDVTEESRIRRFLSLDWDAIAGIVAAVMALAMHFLHIIEEDVLLMIAVVLLALLFIRDLRRQRIAGLGTSSGQAAIFAADHGLGDAGTRRCRALPENQE